MPIRGTLPRARWIVLTPSIDDDAWRLAIIQAAEAAGLEAFVAPVLETPRFDDPNLVVVTDDADVALAADPSAVVAILPEPETAPDAVALKHAISAPADAWHASLLLARAVGLADAHRVVAAADLAGRPDFIQVFDDLRVVPPRSKAEVSRRPAIAAAFRVYREGASVGAMDVCWAEPLFHYDEKAARRWETPGQLDITGRPRILVYGPYLALPRGRWRIRVKIALDEEAAKREFRLDWGTPVDFSSKALNFKRGGIYAVEIEHAWSHSEPAELRLLLMEGAFDGRVHFLGAMLIQRL